MSETHLVDYAALAHDLDWFPHVEVRPVQAGELRALEWEGEFSHFRRIYEEVYQRVERELALMWVADLPDAGLIGQAFVQLESVSRPQFADGQQRAYVHSFRVRPAFRSSGLGGRIMDIIEEDLKTRGYQTVTLNVVRENERALYFYKRRGYRVVGADPGRWSYTDPQGTSHQVHEPGWRMEKRLSARFANGGR
jgi:ribosomal protein S18 acetylase RimI-like enzyme